jgi:hypothetical protein
MTPIRSELHHRTASGSGRAHRSAIVAAAAAAFGVLLAPAAMSQDASTQAQLQSLKDQVQQLQRQIDQMQRQQQAAPAAAPAPAAAAAPTPAQPDRGAGLHAGPVTVTFGGFTELAGIYRDKNETADVGSNFNTAIPYPNSPNNALSEFRLSARQSRLAILAQGPQDGDTRMEGYFETDFLGAAPTANSIESNSYNLRLRQAYGIYAREDSGFSLLAGQAWSLATLYKVGLKPRSEDIPLTVDAQYVAGFNWTRNAQVRFVERFSDAVSAAVSLESPQALIFNGPNPLPANTVFNNPGGSLFSSGTNYSFDPAPDVIGKIAIDPGFGHYEIYGMARWFRDRAAGANNTVSGGAGGGAFILPLVKDVLDFQVSGLAGKGIGRYGSAQLPDVTLTPTGQFATISEYQLLAGLIVHPAAEWTLYGYFGDEHADATDFTDVTGKLGYGYGSPLYNNSGCLTLGSAKCAANTKSIQQGTAGLWWKYYQGALGNLQLGLQGSYTKREIFTGVGGDPDVNIKMFFVSLRYYPYQK